MRTILFRTLYKGRTIAFAPRYVIGYAFVPVFVCFILFISDSSNRDIINHESHTIAVVEQLKLMDHNQYIYRFKVGRSSYSGYSFMYHAFDVRKHLIVPRKNSIIDVVYAYDDPWHSTTWNPKNAESELFHVFVIPVTLFALLLVSFLENLIVVLFNIKNGKQ